MAQKKIILDFKQQLIATKGFQYKIYINGTILTYGSGINNINLDYKVGGNNAPYQIGIGADLTATINNTLGVLNSIYYFSGSIGGYSTSVSYAIVNNTIEVTIDSAAPESLITFWEVLSDFDYVYLRPSNPCENIYLSNATSVNASPIFGFSPGSYQIRNITLNTIKNVTIPNTFDCLFEKGFSYSVMQGGAALINFSVTASITESNVYLFVSDNVLNVNILGVNAIVEYSLDGITYQESGVFPDITIGTHTIYIRDIYGCIKTFEFVNNGQTNGNVTTPYVFISESNSIRFVKSVVNQNCGNYKNVFNTLSCQETTQIANRFIQLFQTCDIIKTQIKTSYEVLEVAAIDQFGVDTEITANKIVNNIGLEDKRDCVYYVYNGKLAVLYLTGNLYDYGTTDVIGTYELNGLLPEYAVVGTWIETAYGTFQIADIIINDENQRSILFNVAITISGGSTNGTIQTIYNRDSFNIWEFDVNMNDFLDRMISVGIKFSQLVPDSNFPDVYYISEKINVKTRHQRSLELIWSNSKNTDIYFYSGITMKNRLNFAQINTQISDGEVQIQKNDSNIISIDATNYNAVEFEVSFLTTGMVRKILLALKHDNLIIENVPYKLAENPEITRNERSNFYNLKAKLLESGDVWNQGTANTQIIYGNVELIGLLQGDADSEFLRIQ